MKYRNQNELIREIVEVTAHHRAHQRPGIVYPHDLAERAIKEVGKRSDKLGVIKAIESVFKAVEAHYRFAIYRDAEG